MELALPIMPCARFPPHYIKYQSKWQRNAPTWWIYTIQHNIRKMLNSNLYVCGISLLFTVALNSYSIQRRAFFPMHIYLFDWVGNIRFFSPNANAYFNSKHDYFIKCGSIIGFFHNHIVVSYKPTLFAIAFFPSLTCVLFARAYYFFFLLMHVLFT